MEYWGFFAVLLQMVCGFIGGLCSYLLLNWVHTRVLLGLEYRLSDVEGRLTREVKIRASEMSRKAKNLEADALEELQRENVSPKLTLQNWTNQKFKA